MNVKVEISLRLDSAHLSLDKSLEFSECPDVLMIIGDQVVTASCDRVMSIAREISLSRTRSPADFSYVATSRSEFRLRIS
jgi:hypothetical protein